MIFPDFSQLSAVSEKFCRNFENFSYHESKDVRKNNLIVLNELV